MDSAVICDLINCFGLLFCGGFATTKMKAFFHFSDTPFVVQTRITPNNEQSPAEIRLGAYESDFRQLSGYFDRMV